jgi:hypothetical protein
MALDSGSSDLDSFLGKHGNTSNSDTSDLDSFLSRQQSPASSQKPQTTLADRAKDVAITGLKSAIGVPEAALGLADIVTAGKAGKLAEQVGFRPKEAKAFLDEQYSTAQQAANTAVRQADGFIPSLKAYAQNPSVIAHDAGEQILPMLGGGVISQGVRKLAPKVAPYIAGAAGEAALTAGQNIEQVRQETPGGELDFTKQVLPVAASGVLTGAIAAGSGKIADKLGITDVQSVLAGGDVSRTGGLKNIAGTIALEGAGQELPQSIQEQAAQNYAMDRPITEGVGSAAAQGLVLGSAIGAGGAITQGPLSRAANTAQQTGAANAQATDVSDLSADGAAAQGTTGARGQAMGGSGAGVGTANPDVAEERAGTLTQPVSEGGNDDQQAINRIGQSDSGLGADPDIATGGRGNVPPDANLRRNDVAGGAEPLPDEQGNLADQLTEPEAKRQPAKQRIEAALGDPALTDKARQTLQNDLKLLGAASNKALDKTIENIGKRAEKNGVVLPEILPEGVSDVTVNRNLSEAEGDTQESRWHKSNAIQPGQEPVNRPISESAIQQGGIDAKAQTDTGIDEPRTDNAKPNTPKEIGGEVGIGSEKIKPDSSGLAENDKGASNIPAYVRGANGVQTPRPPLADNLTQKSDAELEVLRQNTFNVRNSEALQRRADLVAEQERRKTLPPQESTDEREDANEETRQAPDQKGPLLEQTAPDNKGALTPEIEAYREQETQAQTAQDNPSLAGDQTSTVLPASQVDMGTDDKIQIKNEPVLTHESTPPNNQPPSAQSAPQDANTDSAQPVIPPAQEKLAGTVAGAVEPLPPLGRTEAKKQPSGHYKLFFTGTRNEVFPGEKFKTPTEAKNYLKVESAKRAESNVAPAPGTQAEPVAAAVPTPTKSGKPFSSAEVAQKALKSSAYPETAATHEVVPVDGGFGLAPKGGVSNATLEQTKDIPSLTEEEYLARQGFGRGAIGEAALHRSSNNISKKVWDKKVKAQFDKDSETVEKRAELRQEYQQKLASGEIRQPTLIEQRIRTANGNPDNEAVRAARRLLEKKGIDWKNYQPQEPTLEQTNKQTETPSSSETSGAQPSPILTQPKKPYLLDQKRAYLKANPKAIQSAKDKAFADIEANYEDDLLKSEVQLPFESYRQRNPKMSDGLARQTYDNLRSSFDLPVEQSTNPTEQETKKEEAVDGINTNAKDAYTLKVRQDLANLRTAKPQTADDVPYMDKHVPYAEVFKRVRQSVDDGMVRNNAAQFNLEFNIPFNVADRIHAELAQPLAPTPAKTPEVEANQKDAVAGTVAKNKARIVNDRDDLLAAIAKLGGLNRDEAKAQGIDPKAFGTRASGIKRVFTKAGRSYDEMAELLRGYHFDVPLANDLVAKVSGSINQGEKHYNPAGYERMMAIKQQERFDDEQAQTYADLEDKLDAGEIGIEDLQDALDDFNDIIISETFTGQDAIQSLNDYFGIDDEQATIEASSGTTDSEALQDYTEQDIVDRERTDQRRVKQEETDRIKAEQKARADRERDSLVDDFMGTAPKTNDVFGMTDPLENINKPAQKSPEATPVSEDVSKKGESLDAKFSIAGVNAISADKSQLKRAINLHEQQRGAESIWRETGWYKGEDGKWRFEIDDSQAKLNDNFLNNYESITSSVMRDKEVNENLLKEVFGHEKLYEAYPGIDDLAVNFIPREEGYDFGGSADIRHGIINVVVDQHLTPDNLESILLHEIQHMVQAKEQFANGGDQSQQTVDYVLRYLREEANKKFNGPALREYNRLADELGELYRIQQWANLVDYAHRDSITRNSKLLYQSSQYQKHYREVWDSVGYPPKKRQTDKHRSWLQETSLYLAKKMEEDNAGIPYRERLKQLKESGGENALKNNIARVERRLDKTRPVVRAWEAAGEKLKAAEQVSKTGRSQYFTTDAKHDFYMSLAGEIEARMVEKRRKLTPEERAEFLPLRSEDKYRDTKIVSPPSGLTPFKADRATGSTVAELTAKLDVADKNLLQAGKLNIVQSASSVPDSAVSIDANGIEGFYLKGKVYVVANNVTPENLQSVLRHEYLHASLAENKPLRDRILGAQSELRDIFAQVEAGKYTGRYKTIYDAAMKRVNRANTPAADRYEEFLAYAISEHSKSPQSLPERLAKAVQNLIAAIRAAIFRYTGRIDKISPADLAALAKSSLNYSNNSSSSNAPVMASQKSMPDKITIDGKERWTINSYGKPIAQDEEWIRNFYRWFGESRVTDDQGRPMVVYHGTNKDISEFKNNIKANESGIFFSPSPTIAGGYAGYDYHSGMFHSAEIGNVMPSYLKITNPNVVDFKGDKYGRDKAIKDTLSNDNDGAIFKNHYDAGGVQDQFVVFEPNQVKSAIGNNGNFDPQNPDIRYSLADDVRDNAQNITSGLIERLSTNKTFNWWHKTVGTQFHKALVDKHFGKVFNRSMQFEQDMARLANEAADLAPSLLPKLDDLTDVGNELKEFAQGAVKGQAGRRMIDSRKIGEAVFQTTLQDKPMTDKELTDAGYSESQRKMYREFFAAVNQSLDDLAKSEMFRMARALKIGQAPSNLSLKETADWYAEQAEDANQGKDFIDKAAQVAKLKKEGYAPLMRFGQYTLDVVTPKPDGSEKREFFGMFETEQEAKEMEKAMRSEYPDANIERGIMSQNDWQMFKGVTPETMEVFAKMMNVEQDEAFQAYLKSAVTNRSAMKRLIHRKKMPGFAKDTQRILASLLTSNARAASKNYHLGELVDAIAAIPKTKGDVIDESVELYNYVQNPSAKGAAIRGLMFAWYLGGSVSSAAVNLTQSFTTTLPYLHQFGETKQVARLMGQAMKLAANHNAITGDVGKALQRADKEGITEPHELHMLYGESMRTGMLSNQFLRPLSKVWGSFFSLAESYNRRVSFIAAYNLAKETNQPDPFQFAANAVNETQFVYSKSSRPNWARSTVGSTVFTFKTFTLSYLEFLKRLPAKERALALGVLVLFAGLSGAPGADDLDDLIDTAGQAMGYNTNSKAWKDRVLSDFIGREAAQYALYGLSHGMPFDVSSRLSVGNIIPGSALFKKSEIDKSRDVMEFAGPAGSLSKRIVDAFEAAGSRDSLTGQASAVGKALVPKAMSDVVQAMDMQLTGQYRDTRGRKVADADLPDVIAKALGFQPTSVAEPRRAERYLNQSVTMAKAVEGDIAGLWASGIVEKNRGKVDEAKTMLQDWNTKNPETPIRVNMKQITRRVKQMRLTSGERLLKSTPKEIRRYAREAINE